jgi:hypothetical protein
MRTSFHHQSEAQPPNGPLTAATSPDTPSYMPSYAVRSFWAVDDSGFARRAGEIIARAAAHLKDAVHHRRGNRR